MLLLLVVYVSSFVSCPPKKRFVSSHLTARESRTATRNVIIFMAEVNYSTQEVIDLLCGAMEEVDEPMAEGSDDDFGLESEDEER